MNQIDEVGMLKNIRANPEKNKCAICGDKVHIMVTLEDPKAGVIKVLPLCKTCTHGVTMSLTKRMLHEYDKFVIKG